MAPPKSEGPRPPEPDGAYAAPGRDAAGREVVADSDGAYCAPGREAAPLPTEAYFAPGPEALEREQALFVMGGGPTDDEMKMAMVDLDDALNRLGSSGVLSPKTQAEADALRAKDKKR